MKLTTITFLKPLLLLLTITGGLSVSYSIQENSFLVKSSSFQLIFSTLLNFLGLSANLNHVQAIFLKFYNDSFTVDQIIFILSEFVYLYLIVVITKLVFYSTNKFVQLLNILIEFETKFKNINVFLNFSRIEKLCIFIPISTCKIIYLYGVLYNFVYGIYLITSYKWMTRVFVLNYWFIKISYEVIWWILACLIFFFYNKLNKFTTNNVSGTTAPATLDTLRVLYFLLDEAIELMDSIFGLMLLGVFVNSNIFVQYDFHAIQTSVYNYFNHTDVEKSLWKISVFTRWLFVTLLEVLMQFYICTKVVNEVSTLYLIYYISTQIIKG